MFRPFFGIVDYMYPSVVRTVIVSVYFPFIYGPSRPSAQTGSAKRINPISQSDQSKRKLGCIGHLLSGCAYERRMWTMQPIDWLRLIRQIDSADWFGYMYIYIYIYIFKKGFM